MGTSSGEYELNHETLIKTNSVTASISMNVFRYFNDIRFNFYKDEFAMHNFYLCFLHH